MEKQQKPMPKVSKKVSTTCLILGIIVLIVGIVLIIKGIEANNAAKAAYDYWHEEWWAGRAEITDAPPAFDTTFIILGAFVTFISIALIFVGLGPYIAKISSKYNQEVLSHAGGEMAKTGKMAADVASPAVKTITASVKEGLKSNEEKFCTECGNPMPLGAKFCPHCGKSNSTY